MSYHRLFVALQPPKTARAHLRSLMTGIAGARWQHDEQLHCTLRFLGDLDHHRAEDVAAVLGGLRHTEIEARLCDAGSFESAGRINSLWIGVQPRDALRMLHDKIGRLLGHVGIAADQKAYLPHVTIARFSRSAGPSPDIVAAIGPINITPFRFGEVRLYESLLGPDGATYETIARYPLID